MTKLVRYEKYHFECICGHFEHKFEVIFDPDENPDYDCLYVTVHLNDGLPWYKRIYNGIRYIFGKRSKYGDFAEFILEHDDAKRLSEVCNKFLKITKSNVYPIRTKHF